MAIVASRDDILFKQRFVNNAFLKLYKMQVFCAETAFR